MNHSRSKADEHSEEQFENVITWTDNLVSLTNDSNVFEDSFHEFTMAPKAGSANIGLFESDVAIRDKLLTENLENTSQVTAEQTKHIAKRLTCEFG
jgi:hypothetical protein